MEIPLFISFLFFFLIYNPQIYPENYTEFFKNVLFKLHLLVLYFSCKLFYM